LRPGGEDETLGAMMKGYVLAALLAGGLAASGPARSAPLLRVFISAKQSPARTGHKARRMVDDFWAEIVKRGAATSAGLVFPTTIQIHNMDVLVFYGDKVFPARESQRTDLRVYLQRGGGLVALHNTVAGPHAADFAPRLGMTWETNRCHWEGGVVHVRDLDPNHPITRGLKPFVVADELAVGIRLAPTAHVLARGAFRGGPAVPIAWTVETDGQRTVVILLGHNYATFEQPEFRILLCRAMAWAARFDPNTLLLPAERKRFGEAVPAKKASPVGPPAKPAATAASAR
jgi:type 1 glutamine amidotransferase